MKNAYLLDKNLNIIYVIDTYSSLIWSSRYRELGDFELMIDATTQNLNMLKSSKYIIRDDSDMICRIEKINLKTSKESGDYLIVTGYDLKKILDQRIVWSQTNFNGLVEDYIRKLIYDNVINTNDINRKISNFTLGEKAGFTETINQQVTYDKIGDKIRELCEKYDWGYKVYLNDNKQFVFELFKGEDKSDSVIFSNNFENLNSSNYTEDDSNIATTALVAGEGEGVDRITTTTGLASGIDRYEIYVDARSTSKNIAYDELTTTYPGGSEINEGDITYYQVNGINIAIITTEGETKTAKLTDEIYKENLKTLGEEALAKQKEINSFDGTININQNFVYKVDYDLGDIVTVENDYGISDTPRIVEIIETNDADGYNVEPKFEYTTKNEIVIQSGYILAENSDILKTENNEFLELEEVNSISYSNDVEVPSKKISELSSASDIYDNNCMPVVSNNETKKISYALLKEKLGEEFVSEESDPTVPNFVKNITQNDINNWNNKSDFSGDYNDLDNIPNIPQKISDLVNDSDFATVDDLNAKVDKVEGKDLSTNDFTDNFKNDINQNTQNRHSHSNKSVLDSITAEDVEKWNTSSGSSGEEVVVDYTLTSNTHEVTFNIEIGIDEQLDILISGSTTNNTDVKLQVNGETNGYYQMGHYLNASLTGDGSPGQTNGYRSNKDSFYYAHSMRDDHSIIKGKLGLFYSENNKAYYPRYEWESMTVKNGGQFQSKAFGWLNYKYNDIHIIKLFCGTGNVDFRTGTKINIIKKRKTDF